MSLFNRAWRAGHPYAPRVVDAAEFQRMTRGERVLVAASASGTPIGFVSIWMDDAFVHHLYVDPDAFGLGAGRALLNAAVALTGGRATLKCQTRNAGAMAFYRRLGWTEGERGEAPGTGPWVRLISPAS